MQVSLECPSQVCRAGLRACSFSHISSFHQQQVSYGIWENSCPHITNESLLDLQA